MRPSAARVVGFGRDDLSMAAQLGQIASALPEQRFLVWRLKAALASRGERERLRNAELCRVRELYPGMRVSDASKVIEQQWTGYLAAAWGRDEAAGRIKRQTRGAMATR